MKRRMFHLFVFVTILALTFNAAGVTPAQAAGQAAPAADLIAAFADVPGDILGVSYVHQANDATTYVFSSPSKAFPTGSDASFIGLSSGNAAIIPIPTDGNNNSTNYGDTYNGVNDVTILKIDLMAPTGVDCLRFDVQFFSREYPEYVGDIYDDAFIAELDVNDWSVSGTTITAPHNFALAPGDKVLSINSGLDYSAAKASDTAFYLDGGTDLYSVSSPTTAGAHSLYLTIFDMGDANYDSAVYLDHLRMFNASGTCTTGIVIPPAPTVTDVTPNSGPVAGGTTTVITGTNLTGATVTFGGLSASCTVDSDTQLTCVTPPHAAGPVDVVVTTGGGSATQSLGFTYDLATYTVSGTLGAGGAGGTVTYTGGSTTADGSGNYSFIVDSGWTGTITPSKAGYTFTPAYREVTIPVTADLPDQNFTATEELLCYTLSTAVNPGGSGTVDIGTAQNCAGGYTPGTVVSLTAAPTTGYAFINWSGDASGSDNPLSLTMDANKSVTANFAALPGAFVKYLPANGATNVSTSPLLNWQTSLNATSYEYCIDTSNDGACDGDNWISRGINKSVALNGLEMGTTYYWQVRAVNTAGTTYANSSTWWSFSTPGCYTLTTSVDPSGSVSAYPAPNCTGGKYTSGTVVQLTASPAAGNIFSNWSGDASGSDNPLSVTMDADKNITANFTIAPPSAFTKYVPNGGVTNVSINPLLNWQTSARAASYEYCIDTTLDALCDGENWISRGPNKSIGLTGLLPSTTYSWQVRAINTAGTTYANGGTWWSFTTTACYTLTTNVNPSGSVSVSPAANCAGGKYEAGTLVQLSPKPTSGYAFANWSGDLLGSANPGLVTMDANKNVTANFSSAPPTAFIKYNQANGATGLPTNPLLNWQTSINATNYEYCIDTTPDALCDGDNWISRGTSKSVVPTLAANTTYYWQVRASNAQGTVIANSGTWWSFTTAP